MDHPPPSSSGRSRPRTLDLEACPSNASPASLNPVLENFETPSMPDDFSSTMRGLSGSERIPVLSIEQNEKPGSLEITGEQKPIVNLTNCSISANSGGPEIRSNLTVGVHPATTVLILGPIGSGKSSLLKAILGELPVSYGTLERTTDEMAFCDQYSWLRNNSISENVICDAPKDPQWYETTIEACGLAADIARLPHGDATRVGSKGAKLSGGQKQRLVGPIFQVSLWTMSFLLTIA